MIEKHQKQAEPKNPYSTNEMKITSDMVCDSKTDLGSLPRIFLQMNLVKTKKMKVALIAKPNTVVIMFMSATVAAGMASGNLNRFWSRLCLLSCTRISHQSLRSGAGMVWLKVTKILNILQFAIQLTGVYRIWGER